MFTDQQFFLECLRKYTCTFLLGFVIFSLAGQAQSRKYSNDFLSIGVGARALGMSGANIASATDVTAGYWNPSALCFVQSDLEFSLMHSEYFAGIANYDYGAIARPIDSVSTLGFSVIRFGVDGIPNTTQLIDAGGNLNYDRITTFSAVDYAFLISYARKMAVPGLYLGGNAKIVYRQIGDFANSWGFGLDFSATYQHNSWRFAAMARDITSTYNAWTYSLDEETKRAFIATGNELPQNGLEITLPRLILGAAYTAHFKDLSVLGEINAVFSTDGQRNVLVSADPVSIDPLVGLEFGYDNIVFLRAGVGNIQRVKTFRGTEEISLQPNLGLGCKLGAFSLDYAFSDVGNVSGVLYSHVFSLKFEINKKE